MPNLKVLASKRLNMKAEFKDIVDVSSQSTVKEFIDRVIKENLADPKPTG